MEFQFLSSENVMHIHDAVLNSGELEGMTGDKLLEGVLGRVESLVHYGMVQDAFDLAVMYAVAIAQGHVFNDANKRTAHTTMDFCLQVHGIIITFDAVEVGNIIMEVAQGNMDEVALAAWLRTQIVA